ncbi:Aste57867_24720 [Aphanomyces stellatus]|uniref:Aste57867_24720 protein n=1 Tax=Aphanomyces stellatus TaxID=120398 RepID=A0A485LR89_9STRA|nr:hypothetical protein As57867_024642 [Aphanomyces stellatus]VFU01357.1 Aste57867_24720 [Aphanomyces stellatus]
MVCRAPKELRADKYKNVEDALAGDMENGIFDLSSIGDKVILPATYTGSDRDMSKKYNDSMAVVRKFGKPSLFITFTCNPTWKEISDAHGFFKEFMGLTNKQMAYYRPDVTCRVFRMKLHQLRQDIMSDEFGEVECMTYSVEFQKRGLPHAHILVGLKNEVDNPDVIDGFVSAEIPNKETETVSGVQNKHVKHAF